MVGHSAGQRQGGVPIRKCSHHVNPAAGTTVWPFNHAAGADARPVFYSITIILERSPASGWASFRLMCAYVRIGFICAKEMLRPAFQDAAFLCEFDETNRNDSVRFNHWATNCFSNAVDVKPIFVDTLSLPLLPTIRFRDNHGVEICKLGNINCL